MGTYELPKREIKFRCIYRDEVEYVSFDNGNMRILHELRDRDSVVQYTGLKDKNGVEIYEGDIVTLEISGTNIYKRIVKYGEGYYVPFLYECRNPKDVKVIGNIFENPELLETNQPTT